MHNEENATSVMKQVITLGLKIAKIAIFLFIIPSISGLLCALTTEKTDSLAQFSMQKLFIYFEIILFIVIAYIPAVRKIDKFKASPKVKIIIGIAVFSINALAFFTVFFIGSCAYHQDCP